MGSWIDKVFPFAVGHRTELSAVVLAGLQLAKMVANLSGHPISYETDQAITQASGVLAGSSVAFLGARLARKTPAPPAA